MRSKALYISGFLFLSIMAVLILTNFSCKQTSERNIALLKAIAQHRLNIKTLHDNIATIRLELENFCSQSLQYRFPQLKEIESGRMDVNFKDVAYLKAVRFHFEKTQVYTMILDYNSDTKANPQFVIFLFSNAGINIVRKDIKHKGTFSSYLAPGKPKTDKETIEIPGSLKPNYFLILPLKDKA